MGPTPKKPTSTAVRTKKSLHEQVELWSELARALEEKLDKRTAEVDGLKRALNAKNVAIDDLQEECNFKSGRIADLEQQCLARSAKVSQLCEVIAARRTDEIQEKLLEKSLQVAEGVEEHRALRRVNDDLREELEETAETVATLKKEREKSNRLILELSDVVRTLNKIAVDYEQVDTEGADADSVPQNKPLKNVKCKIEAIERDRQQLVQERDRLREENAAKDAKIQAFESTYHAVNESRVNASNSHSSSFSERSSQDTASVDAKEGYDDNAKALEGEDKDPNCSDRDYIDPISQTAGKESKDDLKEGIPKSFSTQRCPQESPHRSSNVNKLQSDDDDGEDRTDPSCASSTSSNDSSFSTLEAPPPISTEEHEKLKRNFSKALDVIEKLRRERSRRDGSSLSSIPPSEDLQQALEDAKQDMFELEDELAEMREKYEVSSAEYTALREEYEAKVACLTDEIDQLFASQEEVTKLRDDIQATREKYEEVINMNNNLKKDSTDAIAELTERHEQLKKQYADLEMEYSMKIENLEGRLDDCKKEHRAECLDMKKVHQESLETVLRDHATVLEGQRTRYEDLKYEYDTFLEIHLKAEDDGNRLKEHYKESLTKIMELESKLVAQKEAESKAERQSQENLAKANKNTQELLKMSQKLEQEYETVIAEQKRLTQEADSKTLQLRQEHALALVEKEKQQQEAAARYQELRRDFDAALVEHGKCMQEGLQSYQQLKQELDLAKLEHGHIVSELNAAHEGILQEAREKAARDFADHDKKLVCQWTQKFEQLELEAKKRQDYIKLELNRIQFESIQRAAEVRAETKHQIAKLHTESEELQKELKTRDEIKAQYKELARSYHSSLSKIEALIKRGGTGGMKKEHKDAPRTGGTVMERIKLLEKQSDSVLATKPRVPVVSPDKIDFDATFQRDFKSILEKLGYDANFSLSCEPSSDDSDSYGSVSISLDTAIVNFGTETMLVAETKDAEVQTEADHKNSEKVAHTKDAAAKDKYGFDFLRHFVRWRLVNRAVQEMPKLATTRETHESEDLMTIFLLHKRRLQSVHKSLSRRTITILDDLHHPGDASSGGSKVTDKLNPIDPIKHPDSDRSDESTVQSKDTSTVVEKARNEAHRLQCDHLRRVVNVNAAKILSQAREKEFRLLELQYNSLREKYLQAMKLPSSSGRPSSNEPSRPSNIVLNRCDSSQNEDASYQLCLALSSVTSDPTARGYLAEDRSEVDQIRKQLLSAELKVKVTKRQLQAQKVLLAAAQQDHRERDDSLEDTLSRLLSLEFSAETLLSSVVKPPSDEGRHDECRGLKSIGAEIDKSTSTHASGGTSTNPSLSNYSTVPSTHVNSDFTVVGDDDQTSIVTPEGRDETSAGGPPAIFQIEGVRTMSRCSSNDDSVQQAATARGATDVVPAAATSAAANVDRVDRIQLELQRAKEAADTARRKQMEREENLRDVILQYNELRQEHDRLAQVLEAKQRRIDSMEGGDHTNGTTSCPIIHNAGNGGEQEASLASEGVSLHCQRDWEVAQAKVAEMRVELERAHQSAESSRGRQRAVKDHLRDVIDQYKALLDEFLAVLEEKRELEEKMRTRREEGARTPMDPSPRRLLLLEDSVRSRVVVGVPMMPKGDDDNDDKSAGEGRDVELNDDTLRTANGGVGGATDAAGSSNAPGPPVQPDTPTAAVDVDSGDTGRTSHGHIVTTADGFDRAFPPPLPPAKAGGGGVGVGKVRQRVELFESRAVVASRPQPPPPPPGGGPQQRRSSPSSSPSHPPGLLRRQPLYSPQRATPPSRQRQLLPASPSLSVSSQETATVLSNSSSTLVGAKFLPSTAHKAEPMRRKKKKFFLRRGFRGGTQLSGNNNNNNNNHHGGSGTHN